MGITQNNGFCCVFISPRINRYPAAGCNVICVLDQFHDSGIELWRNSRLQRKRACQQRPADRATQPLRNASLPLKREAPPARKQQPRSLPERLEGRRSKRRFLGLSPASYLTRHLIALRLLDTKRLFSKVLLQVLFSRCCFQKCGKRVNCRVKTAQCGRQ